MARTHAEELLHRRRIAVYASRMQAKRAAAARAAQPLAHPSSPTPALPPGTQPPLVSGPDAVATVPPAPVVPSYTPSDLALNPYHWGHAMARGVPPPHVPVRRVRAKLMPPVPQDDPLSVECLQGPVVNPSAVPAAGSVTAASVSGHVQDVGGLGLLAHYSSSDSGDESSDRDRDSDEGGGEAAAGRNDTGGINVTPAQAALVGVAHGFLPHGPSDGATWVRSGSTAQAFVDRAATHANSARPASMPGAPRPNTYVRAGSAPAAARAADIALQRATAHVLRAPQAPQPTATPASPHAMVMPVPDPLAGPGPAEHMLAEPASDQELPGDDEGVYRPPPAHVGPLPRPAPLPPCLLHAFVHPRVPGRDVNPLLRAGMAVHLHECIVTGRKSDLCATQCKDRMRVARAMHADHALGRGCGCASFHRDPTAPNTLVCVECGKETVYTLRVLCADVNCRTFGLLGEACHVCGGIVADTRAATHGHPDVLVRAQYLESLSAQPSLVPADAATAGIDALDASVRPGQKGRTNYVQTPPAGFELNPSLWYVLYTDGGCVFADSTSRCGHSGIGLLLEEHSARPDFANWSATRVRTIFRVSEYLGIGTPDVAEFVCILRAFMLYSRLLPDSDVRSLSAVNTGNVWSPYLRFDRKSMLEHMSYAKLTRRAKCAPHLQPVLDECVRIMRRAGFIPYVSPHTHVRGHGARSAVQGEVNLVADVLATAGIARGARSDCAYVIWASLVTERMPWYRPADPAKVAKAKAQHFREGQRFICGRARPEPQVLPVPAGSAPACPTDDWDWPRAEAWAAAYLNDEVHPDLCLDEAADVSQAVRDAINNSPRCFVRTTDTLTPAVIGVYGQALSLCARALVVSPRVERRRAALLLYQLLPRFILRPTTGTETKEKLARQFLAGRWSECILGYHEACLHYARSEPARRGATDADVPIPAPFRSTHDAQCVPEAGVQTSHTAYDRVIKLVRKGKLKRAATVLLDEKSAPYGSTSFDKYTALLYRPHASPAFNLTHMRASAVEYCSQSVLDCVALDPVPDLDESGFDSSDRPLVTDTLAHQSRGSAPDPGGHHKDHFADLAASPAGVNSLVDMICYIANGGLVKDECSQMLTPSSAAILLKEPNVAKGEQWGDKVRPLGIGDSTGRSVGHVLIKKYTHPDNNIIAKAFLPYNFGIGVPSGVDIVFNILRMCLAGRPGFMAAGTDIKSAFQKMPRQQFLGKLRSHPDLKVFYPFALTCYLYASPIFYGELFKALSEEGARQGCSLGTLLWSTGLDPVLRQVAQKFPEVILLAIADDIWVFGPVTAVLAALADLDRRLKLLQTEGGCLEFEPSKMWAYSHGEDTLTDAVQNGVVFPAGMTLIPASDGYRMLGCFASANPDWLSQTTIEHFAAKHAPLQIAVRNFVEYNSGPTCQCAALLASSLLATRITHVMRMIPPGPVQATVSEHSHTMLCTLSVIMGGDALHMLSPHGDTATNLSGVHRRRVYLARQQAQLPTSVSGAGFTPVDLIHPAAYASSWLETLRFVHSERCDAPLIQALFDGVQLSKTKVQPLQELRQAWHIMRDFVGGDDACLCKALNIVSFDELATCDRTSPQHKLTLVLAHRQFVNLKLIASQISVRTIISLRT